MHVLLWLLIAAAFVGLVIYETVRPRDRWFWLVYALVALTALHAVWDHQRSVEWGICGAIIFYGVDRALDSWRKR